MAAIRTVIRASGPEPVDKLAFARDPGGIANVHWRSE
jgi:hypothetical protein